MITLICATHRPKNQSINIVNAYLALLIELGEQVSVLNMKELPNDLLVGESFGNRSMEMQRLIEAKVMPAEKIIVVSPEYNGSFPGVFKSFIDAVEPDVWKGKKIGLVGVSTGRAGNSRGMDHLTDVFHHLRAEVFSDKVPISNVSEMVNTKGDLTDAATLAVLKRQATGFLSF